MTDRDGVMMSAALMLIAATRGTDDDVALAKKGDAVSLAYLSGKYIGEAQAVVELMRTLHAKSIELEAARS